LVGAACLRDRTHARFQHIFAAMILDPDDLVAGGLWREPHGKSYTVAAFSQRQSKRFRRGQAQEGSMTAGASQPSNTTSRTNSSSSMRITGDQAGAL
jgi:hypothetical protein